MIPNYVYPQQPQYPKPLNPNNGIIWVQGIEGAKAYQMSPNSNIQLMDSENNGIFYIKVTDNIGMANLRVFRYTEIAQQDMQKQESSVDLSEYVKKSELQELLLELMSGREVSNEQSVSATKATKPQSNNQGKSGTN